MHLSNFQKVNQFMTAFGQATYNIPKLELFNDDKLVNLRLSLIKEEFNEIKEAINNNDFVEFIDGIADLLVVTYGTGLAFGCNVDETISDILSNKYDLEQKDKNNYDMVLEVMNYEKNLICTIPQPKLIKGCTKLIDQLIEDINNEIELLYQSINKIKLIKYIPIPNYIIIKRYFNNIIGNIVIKTYKLGITYGIDVNKAFDIVHNSNMSKLCISEDEAKQTVEWYLKNESRYPTPSYKQAVDEKYWIVYEQSTGKVLKSINYTPADLKNLAE